jgi:hypothetical protein
MKQLCRVYSSPRLRETYLYVDVREGFERVPADLLQRFGEPQEALSLVLDESRRLARVDAGDVLRAIRERGYYLQLPPPPGQDVDSVIDRVWGDPERDG